MTRKTAIRLVIAAIIAVTSSVAADQVLSEDHLTWAWLAVAFVATLFGGYLTLRQNGPGTGTRPTDDPDRSLETLAAAVEAVWRPEQRHRRLLNPHPLPTAWTDLGPPIADHWANLRADGLDEPLDLAGCLDLEHPDALAEMITDKRLRGRVVILGEPGAGKTALLVRQALHVLTRRRPGDPVPVLLRLSTWNPGEQTLDRWVADQLKADYGVRQPVPADRLLPLLDGLDEMPAARRRHALLAISDTFDTPLILTSRTTEYLDTLIALPQHTLAAAAVVELTPLSAGTVRDYLRSATSRPHDWTAVFSIDAAEHGGRLAAALTEPLWVDLARTTYADPDQPDNNPAELLALPDAEAVHARLLDRLIPAAYPALGPPGTHIWQRHDAGRWLRHLATDMYRRDTQDLAWWGLIFAVPRAVRLGCGLVGGLAVGGAAGTVVGIAVGAGSAVAGAGAGTGTAAGLVLGLWAGFGKPPAPSWQQIRWRRGKRPLTRRVILGPGAGLTTGLVFGLPFGPVLGLVAGLVAGVAFGVVGMFTTFLPDPDGDASAATNPVALLRSDRRRVITSWLAAALVGGLVAGLIGEVTQSRVFATWLAAGLVGGTMAGLVEGISASAWGCFAGVSRPWWCCRGRLPWRLMTFLDDAHRRGVLRHAGGVYQFRHALLRDRLATSPEQTAQSPPGPSAWRQAGPTTAL